jgi:prephenate dehydratase
MAVRGIRGATTVESNSAEAILQATQELLAAIVTANNVSPEDVASAIFTTTPDLDTAFPARAAREFGWRHVPLLDAVEIEVADSLPRTIRTLIHWNTERPIYDIRHIYLRDAVRLRPDLGSEFAPPEPAPQVEAPPTNGKQLFDVHHTVAFQGEPGAYSQEAVFQRFGPQVSTLACPTFEDVFRAVEDGRATLGLLPVENSQAGSINQAFDLLLDHDLRVVGEVKLRVRHSLMAAPGTQVADIRRVHSHYQALAQCERYLRTRGWEAVVAYDTAGAARELAANPEPGAAAIASALAAEIYGLEVLDSGIEDAPDNTTRFFLLGREEPPPAKRNKTSIVFATMHTPGALYHVLGELATRGINLTKLESRPRRNRPWHYVFYVDLEGHWQDATINRALLGLLTRTAFLKLLGSYPAADE